MNTGAGNQGPTLKISPNQEATHLPDMMEKGSFLKARECNMVRQALFTPHNNVRRQVLSSAQLRKLRHRTAPSGSPHNQAEGVSL